MCSLDDDDDDVFHGDCHDCHIRNQLLDSLIIPVDISLIVCFFLLTGHFLFFSSLERRRQREREMGKERKRTSTAGQAIHSFIHSFLLLVGAHTRLYLLIIAVQATKNPSSVSQLLLTTDPSQRRDRHSMLNFNLT